VTLPGQTDPVRQVQLHYLDLATLALLGDTPERFAGAARVSLGAYGETVRNVARQTKAFVERVGGREPWGGYLTIDPVSQTVVGTCAFKGPPDREGMVEIAYFTFPAYEGQGYATAMGSALRALAAGDPLVRIVRAHTLPQRNASCRVLEKLGFSRTGEVVDPEDGPVWRWDWYPDGGTESAANE
jgi:ribosomal-protein-alanine N-acetyltransferase